MSLLTAEHYAATKFDLPEGGRWTELVAGRVVTLSPPDDQYGNIVRTLATAFAAYVQQTQTGYACFDLGLIVARHPDTVRVPPISYFQGGPLFAEQDQIVTAVRPVVVLEIATGNDRRRTMADRVTGYLQAEIPLIWVADPPLKEVTVFSPQQPQQKLTANESLTGGSVLPGFSVRVGDLFEDPTWWKHTPKPKKGERGA